MKKKRGRPKKVCTECVKVIIPDLSKKYKFLGYCKKCKGMVTKKELVSKFVYVCSVCGKRDRVNTLLKEVVREIMGSKREYLNDTIRHTNASHTLNAGDAHIDIKYLKVVE